MAIFDVHTFVPMNIDKESKQEGALAWWSKGVRPLCCCSWPRLTVSEAPATHASTSRHNAWKKSCIVACHLWKTFTIFLRHFWSPHFWAFAGSQSRLQFEQSSTTATVPSKNASTKGAKQNSLLSGITHLSSGRGWHWCSGPPCRPMMTRADAAAGGSP